MLCFIISIDICCHHITILTARKPDTLWHFEEFIKNTYTHNTHIYIHAHTHTHMALAIYMFVVVNFDALAQASDFLIERRQVVLLCWMQDSNPEGLWNPISSRLNARWQTDWAIEDQAKTWTRQPVPMISEHSAHLTPLPPILSSWHVYAAEHLVALMTCIKL